MDKLIKHKIAELEEKHSEVFENDIMQTVFAREVKKAEDGTVLCFEFDSQVIDERKPLSDRINSVRGLFISKIRFANEIREDYLKSFHECKRLVKENRSIVAEIKKTTKEKNALEELKLKLQDMCRYLQKQTKDIVEEGEKHEKAEEESMEALALKCSATIADINQKLKEQEGLQAKQLEENKQLEEKLVQFEEHAKLRDAHFSTQLKAKILELQLLEAKHEQHMQFIRHERARSDAYKQHIAQLTVTECELKAQLSQYSEKFEHFQDALNRSNGMFTQFEEKMDVMSANIARLEKENQRLKKQSAALDCELIRKVYDKQSLTNQLSALKLEKLKMEKECRKLQLKRCELNTLQKTLSLERLCK